MRSRLSAALAALFLAAGAAAADDTPNSQDWIPDAIELPDDMEVTSDREIGSSTRMFAFATDADGAALIADWRSVLENTPGFSVDPPSDALDIPELEFSGPGIGNAKIALDRGTDGERDVIRMDASLTD
jgi:hypothetical protein